MIESNIFVCAARNLYTLWPGCRPEAEGGFLNTAGNHRNSTAVFPSSVSVRRCRIIFTYKKNSSVRVALTNCHWTVKRALASKSKYTYTNTIFVVSNNIRHFPICVLQDLAVTPATAREFVLDSLYVPFTIFLYLLFSFYCHVVYRLRANTI